MLPNSICRDITFIGYMSDFIPDFNMASEKIRLVPVYNLMIFMLFSCSTSRPQGRKTGLLMKLIGF
jgi:hypothetical protein